MKLPMAIAVLYKVMTETIIHAVIAVKNIDSPFVLGIAFSSIEFFHKLSPLRQQKKTTNVPIRLTVDRRHLLSYSRLFYLIYLLYFNGK